MSIRTTLAALSLAAIIAAPLGLRAADENKEMKTVLSDLHQTNLVEIQLGQLAQTKATDPGVREFGARLIQDHTDADKKTQVLAQSEGIQLEEGKASDKVQDKTNKLQKLNGKDFDKAFAEEMVKDHKKEVSKLEKAMTKLTGTPAESLLKQVIPVMQEHERIANELVAKLEK